MPQRWRWLGARGAAAGGCGTTAAGRFRLWHNGGACSCLGVRGWRLWHNGSWRVPSVAQRWLGLVAGARPGGAAAGGCGTTAAGGFRLWHSGGACSCLGGRGWRLWHNSSSRVPFVAQRWLVLCSGAGGWCSGRGGWGLWHNSGWPVSFVAQRWLVLVLVLSSGRGGSAAVGCSPSARGGHTSAAAPSGAGWPQGRATPSTCSGRVTGACSPAERWTHCGGGPCVTRDLSFSPVQRFSRVPQACGIG